MRTTGGLSAYVETICFFLQGTVEFLLIEVTFDVNADGILNVYAVDKSAGKSQNITVSSDKGRLSKDEIERMINQHSAKDETTTAGNRLGNHLCSTRNTQEDEVLKNTELDGKDTLEGAVNDGGTSWLETRH
eukprot:TRINITY_DN3329_c0_g2_i1.p2 TRINITY_DN3329_c0_g2~~TRINITY_DN3329_c0_g2_i1.p2  ORF type:complete len:132 (+),score=38.88 TRINITY_DN3329_c0_g2_i1:224-619(+)